MSRRVLLIQGHPDPDAGHFGHALAAAYGDAARAACHAVRAVDVAPLDFPLLRRKAEWERGAMPPALLPAQESIRWAEHLAFFFPLWLGSMPARMYRCRYRAHGVKALDAA